MYVSSERKQRMTAGDMRMLQYFQERFLKIINQVAINAEYDWASDCSHGWFLNLEDEAIKEFQDLNAFLKYLSS